MQYRINLPADYDMGIIRDRVERRGSAMDRFPGLRFKAYLIRERRRGEPTNEYAPFYVWDDIEGMRRFLWGGAGFAGIVASFGRPAVQDWTVAAVLDGPSRHHAPRWASRTTTPLPGRAVPEEAVPAAISELRAGLAPEVHSAVLAVDVTTWSLCAFTLLTRSPEVGEAETYELLHLSTGPAA
ncbi:DUF4865 family protein [Saccharothrix coeruleofusca]|nr:DUF4865 family protein [Saccharothrix coeruleofusca]